MHHRVLILPEQRVYHPKRYSSLSHPLNRNIRPPPPAIKVRTRVSRLAKISQIFTETFKFRSLWCLFPVQPRVPYTHSAAKDLRERNDGAIVKQPPSTPSKDSPCIVRMRIVKFICNELRLSRSSGGARG